MNAPERRYDIDCLRVIAIFILIFYHAIIGFQPEIAQTILMPYSKEALGILWIPASMVNVWRIPLLFCISGMGVAFAMQRRNLKALIIDRSVRLLLPLVFGFLVIGPIATTIGQAYYNFPINYFPHYQHLWFLQNIWVYALSYCGIFLLIKKYPRGGFMKVVRKMFANPLGLYLFAIPYLIEGFFLGKNYTIYAQSLHGWAIGAIVFFMGFLMIEEGDTFWKTVAKFKWLFLIIGLSFYLIRVLVFQFTFPNQLLTALESISWIYAVFGLGFSYLQTSGKGLTYLSASVFPVYILHYPLQFLASYLIMPLAIPTYLQFVLVVGFTVGASFGMYELLKWTGPLKLLFGMKWNRIKL